MADAAGATYLRMERHDAMGRVTSVETEPGLGKTYVERTTYDQYGRLYQRFFTGTGVPQCGEVYELKYTSTKATATARRDARQ